MKNQYEVLGKAPGAEDLKKLSNENVHLTIKNLSAGYGKMEILHNFDLFVSKAQSLCLIGPNGAGKSTILHSIYGFTNIFSGQIEIDGKEITNLSPAQKLKSEGIAYILQDNSVFPDMTVEENLLMGGYIKDKTEESFEEAERVLQKYERLKNRRNQPAIDMFPDQLEQLHQPKIPIQRLGQYFLTLNFHQQPVLQAWFPPKIEANFFLLQLIVFHFY